MIPTINFVLREYHISSDIMHEDMLMYQSKLKRTCNMWEQYLIHMGINLLSTDQSSASSYSSMTYESPTMSEDEYVFNAHTPTQNRPHLINGSRASTAPPGSVASTADRRGSLQEWPASPTPWCSLKRKRTESTDRNDTQLEVHGK